MIRVEKYAQQRAEVVKQTEAILAAADTDNDGILTEEQQTEFDGLKAKRAKLDEAIARERELIEAEKSAPAVMVSTCPSISGGSHHSPFSNFSMISARVMYAFSNHQRASFGSCATGSMY